MLSLRSFLVLILGSVLISGCLTDEPLQNQTKGYIGTDQGKVYFQGDFLTLEGSFINDQGLKRIDVINEKLGINFSRDLHGQVEYDLLLVQSLPVLYYPEIHEVLITLTDVNSEITTFTYNVDYAFRPEISNMKFTIDRMDVSMRNFKGRLVDPHGIKSFSFHTLRFGYLINKSFPEGVYSYDLNEDFWFPPDEILGEYPLTLRISNHRGFTLTIRDFKGIIVN